MAMKCLGSRASLVERVSSIAFNRTKAMKLLGSRVTRVERVSSIGFYCTQGLEVPGITLHPSRTGEFNCLRSHPRL